jgi:lipopolysaccharide transport system permease protein/teichoic acid transport system permease protein
MGVVNEAPAAFRSSADRPSLIALIRNAITDVWSRRRLIGYMVRADVKKRGANTVLGNVWWVLDPLITMLIYVLVMTYIFQRSTPDFPLFLLSAMVPFKWFTSTIGSSTHAVTGKQGLIKQIMFPKIILPVTGDLSQVVSFLFGEAVLFVVLLVGFTAHLSIQIIWVPLIAFVQFTFMLGFTFMISAITVFYRDVGIVIGHFMRLLFWITPILWSFNAVAGRGEALEQAMAEADTALGLPIGSLFNVLHYNPIAQLLESYRQVIYGSLGAIAQAEGPKELFWKPATHPDFAMLAVIFVTGIVFIVIGTIVFKRLEPAFAKLL